MRKDESKVLDGLTSYVVCCWALVGSLRIGSRGFVIRPDALTSSRSPRTGMEFEKQRSRDAASLPLRLRNIRGILPSVPMADFVDSMGGRDRAVAIPCFPRVSELKAHWYPAALPHRTESHLLGCDPTCVRVWRWVDSPHARECPHAMCLSSEGPRHDILTASLNPQWQVAEQVMKFEAPSAEVLPSVRSTPGRHCSRR